MHLNCPHCRNPIEVVDSSAAEVLCPSCGSSFHITNNRSTIEYRPAEHGQMFGRFAVQEKVGMGAFGTVYKAIDGDLRRTVAVKVPRAGNVGSSADGVDRFLREARSAAQLRHPSIVTVHEVGVQNEQPYLVSDYIEGVTLADWLTAHQPTFRQAAEWIADLADALHYAHTQGIIHRDVKPSNVMLQSRETNSNKATSTETKDASPLSLPGRESGWERQSRNGAAYRLYLMDFGLAKRDAGEITMTMEGQVLGTPAYMSPEQAKGQGHKVDGRADEYSLGVMLYELLTGELPFRGNSRMLLHQVLHEEPKAPHKINDRIPLDLETICLKAMAKEPNRRFDDCAQLSEDLRRYLNGEPIFARPVGRVERVWRWCRRNPMVAGLTAGIATVLLSATILSCGLAFWAMNEKRRADDNAKKADDSALAAGKSAEDAKMRAEEAMQEKRRADEKAEVAKKEQKKGERLLGLSRVERGLRDWHDGNYFMSLLWFMEQGIADRETQVMGSSLRYRVGIYQRNIRGIKQTHLIPHQNSVYRAVFSPNGNCFLTVSGSKVQVWNTTSGQAVCAALEHYKLVNHASFSPDGRRIVTASDDDAAFVWDAETGKQLPISMKHSSKVLHAIYSHDGRYIVTSSCDESARVWDSTNGHPITLPLKHRVTVGGASFSHDNRRVVTYSADGTAIVWDAVSGKSITPPLRHHGFVVYACFSFDDRRVLTASWDNTARVWDAISGKPLTPPLVHLGCVEYACFSPDGSQIITASRDRSARLWDASTGLPISSPMKHDDGIDFASFSPDGRYIVTASWDNTARVWDASSGMPISAPLYHQDRVVHANFSPDGRRVITASRDKSARMWEATFGYPLTTAPISQPITDEYANFNKDGRVVSLSGTSALVTDSVSGRRLIPPLMHQSRVRFASFSPSGNYVVTASHDKSARIWDASTGKPLTSPLIHKDVVTHASFSSDGRRIVTTSEDQSVRVWDTVDGLPISPPMLHQGRVTQANFNHDGRRLVTYSGDKTLEVWDTSPDERPFFDILKLAQLRVSQKIDETGGLQPLNFESELQPWFNEMKAKYPEEFISTYDDTRRWRLQQIADSARERNLPAALFHQNWLLAEAVLEAASPKSSTTSSSTTPKPTISPK